MGCQNRIRILRRVTMDGDGFLGNVSYPADPQVNHSGGSSSMELLERGVGVFWAVEYLGLPKPGPLRPDIPPLPNPG